LELHLPTLLQLLILELQRVELKNLVSARTDRDEFISANYNAESHLLTGLLWI